MKSLLAPLIVCLSSAFPIATKAQQERLRQDAPWEVVAQPEVQRAEERLKAAGFDPGPVDGVFTPQTETALREYQQTHGLQATGSLNRATEQLLLAEQIHTPRSILPETATPGSYTPGRPSPGSASTPSIPLVPSQ